MHMGGSLWKVSLRGGTLYLMLTKLKIEQKGMSEKMYREFIRILKNDVPKQSQKVSAGQIHQ